MKNTANIFTAWLRWRGHAWEIIADGTTYAEAAAAADVYIAQMADPPKHCEVYIGSRGSKPPMRRGAD